MILTVLFLLLFPLSTFAADSIPVFNVKSYGATGNGATNDHAAIQAAADAAALAQGTLYFPKGNYNVNSELLLASTALAGGGQNHFNIVGDGGVQTVIRCNIPMDGSICVKMLDNKFFKMSGISILNIQAPGKRFGLAFGGHGSGTQAGQAILEQVGIDGFGTCMSTTDGGPGAGDTSSEITFFNLNLQNCGTGFFNNSFNGLNFSFHNLLISNSGVGVHCATAGCYVYGGAGSQNQIDFKFSNGGTSTVTNFRSETIGSLFVDAWSGTNVAITNSVATKATPNSVIIKSATGQMLIANNVLGGFIEVGNNAHIILQNNTINDPTNLAVQSNFGTVNSGFGPGFHSFFSVQFESFGNVRCEQTATVLFNNCVRFQDGKGRIADDDRVIYSQQRTEGARPLSDAQWDVACSGVSPNRQCKVRVRDGATTFEQNIGAAH